MEKLKMQSENLVDSNIDKISAVFPNCVTEGKNENGEIIRVVDFELLKQELSKDIVEGTDERYTLNWAGKKQSILTANAPIAKTLRPCREESVDFDNTKNLYIEGDNLDVLKLLRETYLNKVKMIYIDPPYNTGNDFVYEDDFADSADSYFEKSKSFDEQGNRLFQNNDANGRFHSDWLSMMFSRLRLAKDLLTDDGVIFISISDDEVQNLMKVCDEVFGQSNFCGNIIWNSTKSVTNTALISVSHTYNLIYFKNIEYFIEHRDEFRLPDDGSGFDNPDNDPRGAWKADPFQVGGWRPNQQYLIINPNTKVEYKPNDGCSWKNDYDKFQKLLADNRIVFGKTGDGGPQRKRFIWEAQERGKVVKTWWDDVETTTNGTQLLKKLFDGISLFDNPKPISLIKKFAQLASNKNSLILDFFSGSATTAHAVMQLNAEDNGNRKFIMVQLPEKTDEASGASKAGYKNICEIGKERIRRAGNKIKTENQMTAPNLDIGFRVLKLDTTCMKDVYYAPSEVDQGFLSGLESNIKDDRTAEDLLFQVMLDMGVILSSQIKVLNINGKKVFNVNDNNLICCFDSNLTDDVVTQIAKLKPLYAIFRDSSMESDSTAVNFEQIFSTYSPTTTRRVI